MKSENSFVQVSGWVFKDLTRRSRFVKIILLPKRTKPCWYESTWKSSSLCLFFFVDQLSIIPLYELAVTPGSDRHLLSFLTTRLFARGSRGFHESSPHRSRKASWRRSWNLNLWLLFSSRWHQERSSQIPGVTRSIETITTMTWKCRLTNPFN